MNRRILLLAVLLLSVALFAGIPHPVFVEYTGSPESYDAYLGTDPGTILTEASIGCGFFTEYNMIMVECGNFPIWEYADVLYIIKTDDGVTEWIDIPLEYDNVQIIMGETWYAGTPGGEITQQNVFSQGWNLWSYNVQLADHGVEAVFAGLTYLTKVKSILQSYDPALDPQFNTLTELDDGYGYWVQVSEEDQMDLVGEAIPLTTEIALNSGWNLVAFLPQEAEDLEYAFDALISGGELVKIKSITQSYDPTLDPQFNTLEILSPGNGYWVNVNAAVAFTYPAPAVRGIEAEDEIDYIWTPVIYTNSTCAYAMLEAEGQIGAFAADECRAVTQINNGHVSLVISGEVPETITFKLYQNGKVTDLNTQISTAPGEDIFFEFNDEVAEQTRIISAYPNPFNPETTISYELSAPGMVNLAVYNIKGQKVAELVNQHQDMGPYQVVWQADDNPSGVYFIKLYNGGAVETQKVILMK